MCPTIIELMATPEWVSKTHEWPELPEIFNETEVEDIVNKLLAAGRDIDVRQVGDGYKIKVCPE